MLEPEPTNTERGFGTGLRAKLTAGGEPQAAAPTPRSPGEAIAAASSPQPFELEALRAELSAALAREQELRAALGESERRQGAELAHETAQRNSELDRRAAMLSATEAALEERERQLAARLDEIGERQTQLQELQDELARTDSRLGEREQLVEMKVRELKTADEERAKSAAQLAEQIAGIAAREQALRSTEAGATAKVAELESNSTDARPRSGKCVRRARSSSRRAKGSSTHARRS